MYYVFYDYTGAGRGLEPIGGPFKNKALANDWIKDNEYEDVEEVSVESIKSVPKYIRKEFNL